MAEKHDSTLTDIVDCLRQDAEWMTKSLTHLGITKENTLMWAAANEIEALRASLAEVKSLAKSGMDRIDQLADKQS